MSDKPSGGLSGFSVAVDPTKFPLYGQDDERMAELNNAQLAAVEALRKRYDQPNWFKVAAGFAKPQLGGFTASLGSAMEALGENEEQRRAAQLPIAQMRLELMQQGAILGAHKKANDKFREWAKAHPGQTPPAALLRELEAEAPGLSLGKAIKDEIATAQANQQNAIQRINAKQAAGIALTQADKEYLARMEGEAFHVQEPMTGAEGPDQRNPRPPVTNEQQRNVLPKTIDNFVSESDGNKQNVPSSDEMYPVPKDALELKDDMNKSDRPTSEKAGESRLLPNGARVNDDVYKLHEQGVPVISNVRTPKEQEALRDPNNPNFTREGNPVGTTSKHFTGEAIDVDSRRLTDEHRKILKENGWTQPEWAKERDKNHWERKPVQKVEEEVKFYPPTERKPDIAGLPEADRRAAMESYQKRAQETEAPYVAKIQSWAPIMKGSEFTHTHNRYDRAIDMMEKNPDMSKKVFALMQNSEPLLNALNQGFSGSAAGISAGVRFPVDEFLKAGLPKEAKEFADEMASYLIRIAFDNVKLTGVPLKGAQNEVLQALKTSAHLDQQADVAYKLLLQDRARLDHDKKYFDRINEEKTKYHDVNNSITPYADIFLNSKYLKDIDTEFSKIVRAYNDAKLPVSKR